MAAAGSTSHSHNHKDDANSMISIYASTFATLRAFTACVSVYEEMG